ncbi:hypothetical protein [Tichowtungia aerotolerans]|nr:hypothetical protein [Tichowtungia aerotolerans]
MAYKTRFIEKKDVLSDYRQNQTHINPQQRIVLPANLALPSNTTLRPLKRSIYLKQAARRTAEPFFELRAEVGYIAIAAGKTDFFHRQLAERGELADVLKTAGFNYFSGR